MSEKNWFIDAWAVIDGFAFASHRPPDSMQAELTVFLSPPYFEPESVASITTALAAARGHFQEQFRDASGAEIAFETLAQVVDAVRRAFRAGGLDLSGTGVALPGPDPEPSDSTGARPPGTYVDEVMRKMWPEIRRLLVDEEASEKREAPLRAALSELLDAAAAFLIPKFAGDSIASMLQRDAASPGRSSESLRDVCSWIAVLRRCGVEISAQEEPTSAAGLQILAGPAGWTSNLAWRAPSLSDHELHLIHSASWSAAIGGGASTGLAFRIPVVSSFAHSENSAYPRLPTLGHVLAAATADRRYTHALQSVVEVMPLLVLALIEVASPGAQPWPPAGGAKATRAGSPDWAELRERATAWLARALPSTLLHSHPADQEIHNLVRKLAQRPKPEGGLGPPPGRGPGPGPLRPGLLNTPPASRGRVMNA